MLGGNLFIFITLKTVLVVGFSKINIYGGSDKTCKYLVGKIFSKRIRLAADLLVYLAPKSIRDFRVETLKGWREKNNANEGIIFVFKCYLCVTR